MAFCELTMRSTVLKMDVKVSVIIPESRKDYRLDDREHKSKVLYVLHGTSEDNSTWLNSSNIYLNTRDLDLFVVCVSAYNTCYVDTKFCMNMLTYVTEELPSKMCRLFPISDKREDTFLIGESMGGYGTLVCSITHPELYSKVCTLSSGGFRNNKHVLDTGASSVDQLLLQQIAAGKQLPEYYHVCGTNDPLFERATTWEKWVKENAPTVKLTAEYWPGRHDFFFWNTAIPKALEFFGFQQPDRDNMPMNLPGGGIDTSVL